jgi:hypothetical protein
MLDHFAAPDPSLPGAAYKWAPYGPMPSLIAHYYVKADTTRLEETAHVRT